VKRQLRLTERLEAQLVFGSSLDFNKVWVHEEAKWPNTISRIGATLARQSPPAHNAVTLGNHLYFPIRLNTTPPDWSRKDMAWLIHELTHSWQNQQIGIRYFFGAVKAQISLGRKAYNYGGKKGLLEAIDEGKNLDFFNPEMQGDIARDYYFRVKRGLDTSPWDPYIAEIQG
jgi:hypothetical protein